MLTPWLEKIEDGDWQEEWNGVGLCPDGPIVCGFEVEKRWDIPKNAKEIQFRVSIKRLPESVRMRFRRASDKRCGVSWEVQGRKRFLYWETERFLRNFFDHRGVTEGLLSVYVKVYYR